MREHYITFFRGRLVETIIISLVFILASYDFRRDWDENTYLGRAAYAPFNQTDGLFSPRSDRPTGWYLNKVSHLFILRGLYGILGVGKPALFCISLFFAFLVLGAVLMQRLILQEVFKDRPFADEASLIILCSPIALALSHKAVTETTALFFICLSLWLFVRSWKSEPLLKVSLYALSALAFAIATASRMEVVVLVYSFGLALLVLGSEGARVVIKRFAVWTIALAGALALYYLVTGINPYLAVYTQVEANEPRILSKNVLNVLMSLGTFIPLMVLSLGARRTSAFRFAVVLYAVPTIALFVILRKLVVRHQFMSLMGSGVTAYAGLSVLSAWLSRRTGVKISRWLVTILIILVLSGNVLVARTMVWTGLREDTLATVMGTIGRNYPDALVLVDSPTNTFAYLKVAYPAIEFGLTRSGMRFDPEPVDGIDKLRAAANRQPVLLLYPYDREISWLERLLNRIKGREIQKLPIRKLNWMWDHPSVVLAPVASCGQYTVYEVKIRPGEAHPGPDSPLPR